MSNCILQSIVKDAKRPLFANCLFWCHPHMWITSVKSIKNNKLRKIGVSYVSLSWLPSWYFAAQWNESPPWSPPRLSEVVFLCACTAPPAQLPSQASVCLSLDFELLTDRMRSIYSKDPKEKSNMHLNHQAITKKSRRWEKWRKASRIRLNAFLAKWDILKLLQISLMGSLNQSVKL